MKTIINDPVIVNLSPEILMDDEENVMGGKFIWGLFGKPKIMERDDRGLHVLLPNSMNESEKKATLKHMYMMRLFCLHIVKQLIENKEQLDQDFYHKINFEISDELKNVILENLNELERAVLGEIFFHHNPIKPTKTEIKKIQL